MPRRIERLRQELKAAKGDAAVAAAKAAIAEEEKRIAKSEVDAKAEARREQLRKTAAKARKVLAEKRANGTLVKRQRNPMSFAGDETSLLGRIDTALLKMEKRRRDLAEAIGVSLHRISTLGRIERNTGKMPTLKPENLKKAASYLNVTEEYLRDGPDAVDGTRVLVAAKAPVKGAVFHANGHKASITEKLKASVNGNLDQMRDTLWNAMAPDVKVFFLARMTEAVVNKGPQ